VQKREESGGKCAVECKLRVNEGKSARRTAVGEEREEFFSHRWHRWHRYRSKKEIKTE
jgi:hypothetical protein